MSKIERQIVNESNLASLGVTWPKIPWACVMNFSKSSVTEIILCSTLMLSEEVLPLISLSRKVDFCGSCCP